MSQNQEEIGHRQQVDPVDHYNLQRASIPLKERFWRRDASAGDGRVVQATIAVDAFRSSARTAAVEFRETATHQESESDQTLPHSEKLQRDCVWYHAAGQDARETRFLS